METALILYHLQQAELEQAESIQRLAKVKAILDDTSQVDAANAAAEKAQAALTKAQTAVRAIELEVQGVTAKRKNSEERMFSGRVTNPKELSSLQDESESLKRRIAKLEDDLLEAMIQLEETQEKQKKTAQALDVATGQRQQQVADATRERGELELRISDLGSSIAETRASLAPDDLSLYDHLAPRKANRPVALLSRSNVCGACGVAVPLATAQQARERKQTAFCPSCERVLYHEA